jgi:cardiolipin synthase
MANAFERMWERGRKSRKLPPKTVSRDPEFIYSTNEPSPGHHHISHKVIRALSKARHYVYITMPYFVPTGRLLRAIKAAARRGVDVRLIMPEKSDHYPALDLGARSFFSTLLESGIRIFLYPNNHGSIIHSKTMIVDGTWGTIGSMNFDNASLLYNYEANIITNNTLLIEELAAHFVRDMSISKEVSLTEWKSRFFIEKIPEIAIKLVRKFL